MLRASLRPSDHSLPVKTTVWPRRVSDIRSRSRWSRTAPMSIYNRHHMILAGDIGGTKTLIGLFHPAARRPTPVDVREFRTTTYGGLPAIIDEFLGAQPGRTVISTAAFGIAGPIINQS